ncbi:MAG TPA: hypothetical protein VK518_23700 [Puia sp.]|nr:hypothetical protein [Puia sp.]
MATNEKGAKITLVGGNKAADVNPLGLVKQYKAVCVTQHIVLSPQWRNTKAEATADAAEHIEMGHFIDFNTRITSA